MVSVRYLDKNITTQLINMNCPNIVFRNVWQYCPHTTRPEIPNLKEDLYKSILSLGYIKNNYVYSSLNRLFDLLGSYKKIVIFINLIYKNNELRREIFNAPGSAKIITMGKYIRYRHNLIRMGLITE